MRTARTSTERKVNSARFRLIRVSIPAAVCSWWIGRGTAYACAVCFGDGESLAGFIVSWAFLVLMPFAVIGSIAYWLVRMYRRGQSRDLNGPPRRPALTQEESGY